MNVLRLGLGLLSLSSLVVVSLSATGSFAAAVTTATSDLQIDVVGVTPNKGPVIISIYKDEDGWLKRDKALQIHKLAPDQAKLSTHVKVPPGTYAVQIFQDENNNDKLDMQWLPPGPAEPWVVSNNAQGSMGPPSFKDAKFNVPGDLTLLMTLQQP